MPDPQRVLPTLRRAALLFRSTPGRHGSIIHVDESVTELLVVGDLHGNIPAFRQILALADLPGHPGRHLVLQELIHGPREYPNDGGDRSHQLLDLVAALKCQYPERVHLILGNHELSELTGRIIAKGGEVLNHKFRQGIHTAYGDAGAEVYSTYHELFRSLPIAIRTWNRVLICHTIPDAEDLDRIDLTLLDGTTWPPASMQRHGTIYAMTWGRDTAPETVDRFAAMIDADLFVTGHQPCEQGFKRANHRQLIIDGTDPYPTACRVPNRDPVSIEILEENIVRIPLDLT